METTLNDPNYLGAVSVAGAANLQQLLSQMGDGNSSAAYYLTYMAYAIRARSPQFKPSDMLTGPALERYRAATTQGCWNYAYASFLKAPKAKNLKAGWDQLPGAQQFFRDNELGTAPVGKPLFVIGGEADETVPFAALRATAEKACHHGIALTFRSYPGLDHDPTMENSTPDQLAWVRDRLSGRAALDSCPSLLKLAQNPP
jgi:pimeloyl-ACP methyl ester carboxylesterase